jgi:hypothetical protein
MRHEGAARLDGGEEVDGGETETEGQKRFLYAPSGCVRLPRQRRREWGLRRPGVSGTSRADCKRSEAAICENAGTTNHGTRHPGEIDLENITQCSMYTCYLAPCQNQLLLGRYDLELLWAVSKQVGIGLGDGLPLVGLLNKVLVALLISELDSVLLGFELYPVAVHEVGR